MDEIKTLDELWTFMKDNIKYGWTNKNHEFREYDDKRQCDEYFLHSASETIQDGCGICMDQVELEKEFCRKNNLEYHAISFQFYNEDKELVNPGHTFMIIRENNVLKYFERAFYPCANITEFSSLEEAIVMPIVWYMSCLSIDSSIIPFIDLKVDPEVKPGMNTDDIYKVKLTTENKIGDYQDLLFDKYNEFTNSNTY